MVEYQRLKKLRYTDPDVDHASKRRSSDSAIHLAFEIGESSLFYVITPEMVGLAEQIHGRERTIDMLLRELPSSAVSYFVRSLLVDEIVATNDIENIHSTRKEASDALDAAPDSGVRLSSFASLMWAIVNDVSSIPLESLENIRDIYNSVTAGEIPEGDLPDGELFRAEIVEVRSSAQKVAHRGYHPEEKIKNGLAVMLQEWESPSSSKLNAAILCHLMFEIVHPFYDGNGRTGRYLLTRQLRETLSIVTALTVSKRILDDRDAYYREFKQVEDPRNHGEATHFILFFLALIAEGQQHVIGELEASSRTLLALSDIIRDTIQDSTMGSVVYVLAQAETFGSGPVSLDDLANTIGSDRRTIRTRLTTLEDWGLIEILSRRPLRVALADNAVERIMNDDAP